MNKVNVMKYKPAKGNSKIPTKEVLTAMWRDSIMRNHNNMSKALLNMAVLLKCNTAYLARRLKEHGIDYKSIRAPRIDAIPAMPGYPATKASHNNAWITAMYCTKGCPNNHTLVDKGVMSLIKSDSIVVCAECGGSILLKDTSIQNYCNTTIG